MQGTGKLGGIIVYIFKNTAKVLTKIENSSTEAIWMKLDKLYFSLNKNHYLCAQYICYLRRWA